MTNVFSRLYRTTRNSCQILLKFRHQLEHPKKSSGATYEWRINTRRESAVDIAFWSISIDVSTLSASTSHPSFRACLIPSSLTELVSTRFFKRSTWSPDSRSCLRKRSRVAMYKSRCAFNASKLVSSETRAYGQTASDQSRV